LQAAKLNLSRTSVKAPFSGRVRTKSSDIGQFVTPGSRLGRIFSKDIVEVRLPLSDAQLAKLELPLAFVAVNREAAPRVDLSALVAGEIRQCVITIPRDGLRPQDEVYVVDTVGKAEIRKVDVLDATPERAVLTGGVEVGELVVLSPMERSRTEMTLKVLDVNDPETVLVDPPKPDWMKKQEAEEGKAEADGEAKDKNEKRRWGKKKKDGQAEGNEDKADDTADADASKAAED